PASSSGCRWSERNPQRRFERTCCNGRVTAVFPHAARLDYVRIRPYLATPPDADQADFYLCHLCNTWLIFTGGKMKQKPDAIIIGAGLIGCAIAYELSKRGY